MRHAFCRIVVQVLTNSSCSTFNSCCR